MRVEDPRSMPRGIGQIREPVVYGSLSSPESELSDLEKLSKFHKLKSFANRLQERAGDSSLFSDHLFVPANTGIFRFSKKGETHMILEIVAIALFGTVTLFASAMTIKGLTTLVFTPNKK